MSLSALHCLPCPCTAPAWPAPALSALPLHCPALALHYLPCPALHYWGPAHPLPLPCLFFRSYVTMHTGLHAGSSKRLSR